jgi:hypothetical protein
MSLFLPCWTRATWGVLPSLLLPLGSLLLVPGPARAATSFRNEVMAVLSRAGCNQGPCHGNQKGKGGFKLSLRGQDPQADFEALTRGMLARRVDPLRPDRSLVLKKATGQVAHGGGRRFGRGSHEYEILRQWIASGCQPDGPSTPTVQRLEVTPRQQVVLAPQQEIALRVRAFFSDGHNRDVTNLAVFEPSNLAVRMSQEGIAERQDFGETAILVRYLNRQATVQLAFVPARPDFVWTEVPTANYIDEHVFAKLRQLRMHPAPLSSDVVFLRRAYLDALGILPSAAEARAFLDDTRADRRARLIDTLLERPEFADFWALKWSDLLRNEEKVIDRKGVRLFHGWIRRALAEGMPLNEFARDLISSRGSTYRHPESNYYRALRDPQLRAEVTAQVFLGVRLQCARCHNHPFDRWTQTDYHSLSAFFTPIRYRIVENNRRDRFDKHQFDGEQIVWLARDDPGVTHPRTGEPLRPLFLGAQTPRFPAGSDQLQALADWIADPDNPFFARTQVNRVWYHLMGKGIVDPIDDFRASNPPVNAPLLEALTRDFIAHQFDLRHLVRTIMNSRTYQLSALPNETNRDDESNFSHALVRPLQAEVLLDALTQVTGVPVEFPGFPPGTRAGQLPGAFTDRSRRQKPSEAEKFLKVFGKPVRSLSCECERSDDQTLNQAFQLITGRLLNDMLSNPDNRIGKLLASGKPVSTVIEELYWAALSRPPSDRERERTLAMVQGAENQRRALEDVLWGLVNAKEFLFRR